MCIYINIYNIFRLTTTLARSRDSIKTTGWVWPPHCRLADCPPESSRRGVCTVDGKSAVQDHSLWEKCPTPYISIYTSLATMATDATKTPPGRKQLCLFLLFPTPAALEHAIRRNSDKFPTSQSRQHITKKQRFHTQQEQDKSSVSWIVRS